MDIAVYLTEIAKTFDSGLATEHSYRPALKSLFDSITADVTALNEPRAVKVGRPDFVFQRGPITVGHCEAKDIGLDITPKGMSDSNKAQYERYRKALPNLVYTNGLDFRFYKHGELTREISIADLLMGIQPKPDQFSALANQLKDFAAERLQTITSAEQLAKMMAGKAILIKDILFNSLKEDKDLQTELTGQLKAFRDQLIHDLSVEDFADIYAETIAYGLFGARLHDTTLKDFSREEALQLLPKSNPFLRNLFSYVAGPQLDERIRRTIDELAEIFQATDLSKLFADFGKFTQRNDPFIHFYETFLAEYNPAKRKSRGVWYTPEPVVNFIVRAVDDVLKTEFGLADGLADTSKITVDWDTGQKDKKGKPHIIRKDVHRVQILDPAAGTGTFLAEVIKQIAPRIKNVASGQWSSYVEKELIPRLHGFELLMASYAMCHMKLDMMLTELGYKPTGTNPPRLSVYLTNSLEEGEKANQTLPFAQWLSNEAKEASTVKRDMPIMCVIGNPPYSGESANKGDWIMSLMEDYKKEPGGKEKLKEKNPKWINDDYVKFIRFAEHLIEKNGEGVLGFITNHGYLDNPTFRGMRWHLLKTFDKIWVVDLHGSTKKQEQSPDGSPDKNVFDIMPGVAVIIAFKSAMKNQMPLAEVFHGEVWGDRETKYKNLWKHSHHQIVKSQLTMREPQFQLVFRDFGAEKNYNAGFNVSKLFLSGTLGFQTHRDDFAVSFSKQELESRLASMGDVLLSNEQFAQKYFLHDNRDWQVSSARLKLQEMDSHQRLLQICAYRPFDFRWCILDEVAMDYPRPEFNSHILDRKNICLVTPRQTATVGYFHSFTTSFVAESCLISNKSREGNVNFPLYQFENLDQTRRVNFDSQIHKAIEDAAEDSAHGRPDEVAIFDYIYGVLHCRAYRETYREFLKIDFPRIPYPPSPQVFRDVSAKGTQLRRLHLMEDQAIGETPYPFTGEGDSIVRKVAFKPLGGTEETGIHGAVYINDTQCFETVPKLSWEFYIGGYQPAQKWLKDRKGRELSFEDIRHYRKIVKILSETGRIMKTIQMPLG